MACCWVSGMTLFIPKADIHNVDTQPLGWVLSGVGVVLCENCIVDASIFIFCKFYCVSECRIGLLLWVGVF